MCLLDVIVKLKEDFELHPVAIHLNHNWRGAESRQEEEHYRHFCIEKGVSGRQTQTIVRVLNPQEEVRELARMLGGAEITETVIQSAREMKELAGRTKNN